MTEPTFKRYSILILIFFTVVVSYVGRSNLSVAAVAFQQELGFSTIQLGFVFSAFAWTLFTAHFSSKVLGNFVGSRLLNSLFLVAWSMATVALGAINSLTAFIGLRTLMGVFDASSYWVNEKIVKSWFPEQEQYGAKSVYTSAPYLGLACFTPLLIITQNYLGWRGLLMGSGVVGLGAALLWYAIYRDPTEHRGVNQTELEYISPTESSKSKRPRVKESSIHSVKSYREVLVQREFWGLFIIQFCQSSLFIFFITWFPIYLVRDQGLDFIQLGFWASFPFIAAFAGALMAGSVSFYFEQKGRTTTAAKRAPILAGLFFSIFIAGANFTDSTIILMTFLSLALFGNGLASMGGLMVTSLASERLTGLVKGLLITIDGLSAAITPVAIGYLVAGGDFAPAILYLGILASVGLGSYLLLAKNIPPFDHPIWKIHRRKAKS